MSGMYGLERTNHDFSEQRSWGKNIFTNTLPISLAQYQAGVMNEDTVLVRAIAPHPNEISTQQSLEPWASIIGTSPTTAGFLFEQPFDGFKDYTRATPEKSDVVVTNASGAHCRALEIKLTAVPDSTTKNQPREEQSCELVFRPTTVEQLAYSICESYGPEGRQELNELILDQIAAPQQFRWHDEAFVRDHMTEIVATVEKLIVAGLDDQIPMLLHAIWRTVDTSPILDEQCFDIFVWTNFALLVMFLDAARHRNSREITRAQRSLVWLVKLLFDYSTQRHVARLDTFRDIAFGNQTDKAGAFSGRATITYLQGRYLTSPRIPRTALAQVIDDVGVAYLAPERRLDAAIYFQARAARILSHPTN